MQERIKEGTALVVFGEEMPRGWLKSGRRYDAVIASSNLQGEVESAGFAWQSLDELVGPGSVYNAAALLKELSQLLLPNGSRLVKATVYKGYELWWGHYSNLFLYFCLPYTQYRKLLEYLRQFGTVSVYQTPYEALITAYLTAYGIRLSLLRKGRLKSPSVLPLGVFLQMLLTAVSVLILMVRKRRLAVFTGDKFGKDKDYDVRMKLIYEELRGRHIPFVEVIRSLEPSANVLAHAWKRRRPAIYSEAVTFLGRFISVLSGGRARTRKKFAFNAIAGEADPEQRFKFAISSQYLLAECDDIWAIRIMRLLMRATGIRVLCTTATTERSWHTILACKLNGIPTIGIMHGVAPRSYVMYDFLPGFDGAKTLSTDRYGLWSEWWKDYYLKYSDAYRPEQLFVSGPMRPLERAQEEPAPSKGNGRLKVLFIAEQLGYPPEVLPYLSALIDMDDIDLYIKFRPYRDGFEQWLAKHRPELLRGVTVLRGSVSEAVSICDVVVGSHSTAALEALLALKPPIFYKTEKWGDYFELKEYGSSHAFFAQTPEELIMRVRGSKSTAPAELRELQERYFGDPHKNGSAWVVDQAEKILRRDGPFL